MQSSNAIWPGGCNGSCVVAQQAGLLALDLEQSMWHKDRHIDLAVAVVVAALVTISCGGAEVDATAALGPSPTPTPTPPPIDAEATLSRSGKIMGQLRSFSFNLKHKGGGTEFLPGMIVEEAAGTVVNPDKISVSFSGTFGEKYAYRASLVTLGGESYMTNPLTDVWEAMPTGVSPLGFFNPTQGIAGIMLQLGQVRLAGDGARGGELRLSGVLPAAALAPLLGGTLEGVTVRVELVIDSMALYLLQARIMGRVTPNDPEGIVRVIVVSAFDEPVVIEAPERP